MKADIDLDIGRKTFASGLLPELIVVLHASRPPQPDRLAGWRGYSVVAQLGCLPKPIGRSARGFGSTQISTVTSVATTVVCVLRRPRLAENWDSNVYSGSLAKPRSLR